MTWRKLLRQPIVMGLLLTGLLLTGAGCAAFRHSVSERDPARTGPLGASYDQRDLLTLADDMAREIMAHPFPPADVPRPIIVDLGLQNRTQSHIDMRALSEAITLNLLNAGRIQLVNAARRDDLLREQGFQLANVTPETRVQVGRQLGARYMLTGAMTEITQESGKQARVSKQKDVFYRLTVEITDLETGLIVCMKQRDRMRRASTPLIGW